MAKSLNKTKGNPPSRQASRFSEMSYYQHGFDRSKASQCSIAQVVAFVYAAYGLCNPHDLYIYIWNTSPHTNNSLIIYIYIVPAGNKRNIVTRGRGDRFVAVRSTHKLVSHALLCTPAAAKANVRVDRQTSHFKLRVLDNG